MIETRHRFAGVSLIVALCVSACHGQGTGTATDVHQIRDLLKQSWDSLETLDVSGEEYPSDESGARRGGPVAVHEFHLLIGSGGRRAFTDLSRPAVGARRVVEMFREDGRRNFQIIPFPDDPASIDTVKITGQTNTRLKYTGSMNPFLWMFTPGGIPSYAHVDKSSGIRVEGTGSHSRKVVITSSHKGAPLNIVLDAEHGWLPREIATPQKEFCWRATSFSRMNGLWIPATGVEIMRTAPGAPQCQGFTLTRIKINDPLPDSRFAMPELADGVQIRNLITTKTEIKGGVDARLELERKHAASIEASAGERVTASQDPDRFPWSIVIALASTCGLVAAWHLSNRSMSRV